MSPGRPPRNPVEVLKTKTFTAYFCQVTNIPFKGCQIEPFLEPNKIQSKDDGTKIRSCKWDRFVNGIHTPRTSSRQIIYNKVGYKDSLESFFNHPIWIALAAGDFDSQYWLNFYQSLPLNIQSIIFKKNEVVGQPRTIKTIRMSTIKAILKLWNNDAFACLVALTRDKNVNIECFAKQELAYFIHKYLQYLLEMSLFSRFSYELWDYFQTYLVPNSLLAKSHQDLWFGGYQRTKDFSYAMGVNYLIAEDVQIIGSQRSGKLFLYWKLFGDTQLINDELHDAFDCVQYQLPDSDHGLKWLIQKMNQYLPKSEQINTVVI